MASLFKEEFEQALFSSATVYVGNMSFYTTEEQVYELFTRAGETKKIIMVLDKNTETPCGFCFFVYYSREDSKAAVKYVSGNILDDVQYVWILTGLFRRDDNGVVVETVIKGGYGKLVQKELEAQRELVDYGAGSLESFPPVVLPPLYGRQGSSGDELQAR